MPLFPNIRGKVLSGAVEKDVRSFNDCPRFVSSNPTRVTSAKADSESLGRSLKRAPSFFGIRRVNYVSHFFD